MEIWSCRHEVLYQLRDELAPVCDILIEYWEHAEDDEDPDELAIQVKWRVMAHGLAIFGRDRTSQEIRAAIVKAAQYELFGRAGLVIEPGLDDEINEYEVMVSFRLTPTELKLALFTPEFRPAVERFAKALEGFLKLERVAADLASSPPSP